MFKSRNKLTTKEQRLLSFFAQHFVPILVVFEDAEGKTYPQIFSAFVLSVREQWFLCTAGHCVDELKRNIASYPRFRATLIDSIGYRARFEELIPFDISSDTFIQIGDNSELDYAVCILSDYYVNLLINNGVEPLDERVWRSKPDRPSFHILIGVPFETVLHSDNSSKDSMRFETYCQPVMLKLLKLSEKPVEFKDDENDLWYGKIVDGPKLESAVGMSGGPILSIEETEDGQWKYWISAIQSRWYRSKKIVACAPVDLLGEHLTNQIIEFEKLQRSKENVDP